MKKNALSTMVLLAAVAISSIAAGRISALRADEEEPVAQKYQALVVSELKLDESNFPDERFRELLSAYDLDNSGGLSKNEISEVTKLRVQYYQIKDLKGIEYFTELEKLECQGNEIESLDLSSNTKLKEMNCYSNSLTKLNLEANTELQILNLNYNPIIELNVSANTKLQKLYISETSLKTVNLESNTELEYLSAERSMLESLDISNNTKLTSVLLIETKLESLNTEKNTELQTLNVALNAITSLDLRNNVKLESLDVEGTSLTELDVSTCTKLQMLRCSESKLQTLILGSNEDLWYLNCLNTELKEVDISNCTKLVNLVTTTTIIHVDDPYSNYYCFKSSSPQTMIYFDITTDLIPSGNWGVGTVTGLKASSAGKNKVQLTWDQVDNADGYLVYGQKDGKYGYVGMTTRGTTFTDTKALDTDYNYYWVFAYIKAGSGKMHTGGCEKYVYAKGLTLAVTDLKAASVTGGVKLSWTASSGADGYLVYGIRPGGAYGYIGMTTRGTTFTDAKASITEYTFYWVFPYHKAADGSMLVGGTAKYTYGRAK